MNKILITLLTVFFFLQGCLLNKNKIDNSELWSQALRQPQLVSPFQWAALSGQLFENNMKKRAAFSFYVFQLRTAALAQVSTDPSGSPALRTSLNQSLGQKVNLWTAQDPDLMFELASKAIEFEQTLSQESFKPKHISLAKWNKTVSKTRNDYKNGLLGALGTTDKRRAMSRSRKMNGLPTGNIKDLGPDLPAEWL